MPLYISNTNRVETLQGAQRRGINSTTTTTLVPPAVSFWWAKTGDFQSGSFGGQWFQPQTPVAPTNWNVSGPGKWFGGALSINWDTDNPPPLVSNNFGLTPYGGSDKTNTMSIWRSPFSASFEVTPSIFGKVTTFANTNASGSGKWMLASYVAWSGSNITYEFVPPSSSIQRCVTYPYLANFAGPMVGGYGDTSYISPLDASAFGADCQYDTYCECVNCYQGDAYIGGPTIVSGSQPCQSGGTTTTTSTTSTTTSTTTTSTTTSTTTTTTPVSSSYQVEYLIVAGGGAGGPDNASGLDASGGGGAGGFISSSLFVTSSTAYPIVVGTGGTGFNGDTGAGNNGSGSSVFGFSALGGGGGASQAGDAANGGSGGGGASRGSTNPVRLFGSGSGTQGFNGGSATQATNGAGGGGGGAFSAGSTPGTNTYGGGGSGKLWLDGTLYAKGGDTMGSGTTPQSAVNGTDNTGNGGGGVKNSGTTAGGDGGSGIVAIRYVSGSASATGGTIVNSGGYTYHYFTGSGTFTA